MTKDDIIRLFEKANGWSPKGFDKTLDELERFAALVAAHEREKVAQWMMAKGYATGHGDTIEDLLTELDWQVREREREANCACIGRIAAIVADPIDQTRLYEAMTAIRARGNNDKPI